MNEKHNTNLVYNKKKICVESEVKSSGKRGEFLFRRDSFRDDAW